MGWVFWLLLKGTIALQCLYDRPVLEYPLELDQNRKYVLGTVENLKDLPGIQRGRTKPHTGKEILKDLKRLIDDYVYRFNVSTRLDTTRMLENGIDFNDPEVGKILNLSNGKLYHLDQHNSERDNGNELYFSVCSMHKRHGFKPKVLPRSTPDALIRCSVTDYPCGFGVIEPDPVYDCLTYYKCMSRGNLTHSCDHREKLNITYAHCFPMQEATDKTECIGKTIKSVGKDECTEEDEMCVIRGSCDCHEDNCNHHMQIDHVWMEVNTEPPPPPPIFLYKIIMISVPILCVIVVVFFAFYKCFARSHAENDNLNGTMNEQIPILTVNGIDSQTDVNQTSPTQLDSQTLWMNDIKLDQKIAHGRYGTVWTGKVGGHVYAIKTFSDLERNSWENEKSIYAMLKPLMEIHNPNVLNFMGAQERLDDSREFWIVTEYHANGSLTDFLKANVLTYSQLLKVISSMADGLRFLHEDMTPNFTGLSEGKPSVAHRDFKSRNVLLRSDLTAVISDFGLAILFKLGENLGDAHPSVGTRRYMAPEILERAISFHRDAFLRIDMYAYALVMWECLCRCEDLPRGAAPHNLPYEYELGEFPSLDDLQNRVVDDNLRPEFRNKSTDKEDDPSWDTDEKFTELCGTIRDCWDCDAEARLTAGCVLKRVLEIQTKFNCMPNKSADRRVTRPSSSDGSSSGAPFESPHQMNSLQTSTPIPDQYNPQRPQGQPEPVFGFLLNQSRANPYDPNFTPDNVTMNTDGTFSSGPAFHRR